MEQWSVGDMATVLTEDELLLVENCGSFTVREIRDWMERHGLYLRSR